MANFAFPGLSENLGLEGFYGKEGVNVVRNQLRSYSDILNRLIASQILGDKNTELESDLIYMSGNNRTITCSIFLSNFQLL